MPRGNPEGPFEGYPAFGAVHELIPDDGIRNFLFDFSRISDLILKQSLGGVEVEPITTEDFGNPHFFEEAAQRLPRVSDALEAYNPKQYYKIFDVDTLGVSVLEMDPSAKQARVVGAIWEGKDFGAVEQEARNEVDRLAPGLVPRLEFSGVEGVGRRLPNVDQTQVRQKLALMPDTAKHQDTLELLDHEEEKVASAINRRLKQFIAPWDRVTHLTFAVFKQKTKSYEIDAIQQSARNYVSQFPVEVRFHSVIDL